MSEKHSGLSVSRYFGKRLVELADLREGDKVLDVGFGRGASLFPAAQRVGSQGQVTGIEIDETDVEVVRARIAEQGVTNASVHKMDAWHMTFRDASFDFILGGNVIGYLLEEDTNQLCPEIARVLRPDGGVGFSTWKVMEDLDWMLEYLKTELPEVPESQLSVYSRYSLEDLTTTLLAAGFHQIRKHTITAECVYPDKETWWEGMQLRTWKPFYANLAAKDSERFVEFKETIYQELESRIHGEGIQFLTSAILIYGKK